MLDSWTITASWAVWYRITFGREVPRFWWKKVVVTVRIFGDVSNKSEVDTIKQSSCALVYVKYYKHKQQENTFF